MKRQKDSPTVAGTTAGQINTKQNRLEDILTHKNINLPSIPIPKHIYEKLIRIGSYWEVPGYLLGASEITKFVIKNWDHKRLKPIKRERS